MSQFLADDVFQLIIKNTPLISIDLIVRNQNNQVLLGKRKNKPAKDYWFVPGGRIRKNERIVDAFERIVGDEVGISYPFQVAIFQGFYEHLYVDCVFGDDISTHYVVLAFQLDLDYSLDISGLSESQHQEFRWFLENEIMSDKSVHVNTQAYFN